MLGYGGCGCCGMMVMEIQSASDEIVLIEETDEYYEALGLWGELL